MADPNTHVPDHHDPEHNSDESLGFDFQFSDPPSGENIMLDEDVTKLVQERRKKMLNEDVIQIGLDTSQTGPSAGLNGQSNEDLSGNLNRDFSNFGNPTPLAQWPVPEQPYSCSCCQVLREIIHTIDGESRKFEIHGRVGEIFHGILEICRRDVHPPYKVYQMFDFCKETILDIKAFLVQYCEDRTDAGYTMVKDPLLEFNEALNIGSDWDYDPNADEFSLGSLMDIDDNTGQPPEEPDDSQPQARRNGKGSKGKGKLVVNEKGSKGKGKLAASEKGSKGKGKLVVNEASKKVSKRTKNKGKRIYKEGQRIYKEQRVFTRQLEMKDFADYLHLPMYAAAKKYEISSRALKNLCDRKSFTWPYEKIKKCERQIKRNRAVLNSSADAKEKRRVEAEIIELEQEIASLLAPTFKDK
ncbi:hypothetical protein ACET3Z_004184 [Daucus carota]